MFFKKFSWKWIPMFLLLFFTLSFILFEFSGFVNFNDIITSIKSSGSMAGLIIILLLSIDIIAPIPSSILLSLSGSIYGFFLGSLIGFTGSLSASFLGFFITRKFRKNIGIKLIGIEELTKLNKWFSKWGGIGIVLSRMVPMVNETLSLLAGLSKMSLKRFFILVLIGTLPLSVYYGYIGSISKTSIEWSIYLTLAFFIPVTLWFFFQKMSTKFL